MNHNPEECQECRNGLKETNKVTDTIGIISLIIIVLLLLIGVK